MDYKSRSESISPCPNWKFSVFSGIVDTELHRMVINVEYSTNSLNQSRHDWSAPSGMSGESFSFKQEDKSLNDSLVLSYRPIMCLCVSLSSSQCFIISLSLTLKVLCVSVPWILFLRGKMFLLCTVDGTIHTVHKRFIEKAICMKI